MSNDKHSHNYFLPSFAHKDERRTIDLNTIAHKSIRSAEADCRWASREEQIRIITTAIIKELSKSEARPSESIINPVE